MYAERIAGIKSSAIGDILQLTTPKDMISFAGGVEFLRTGLRVITASDVVFRGDLAFGTEGFE